MGNTYRVRVIPNLDQRRVITRTMTACNSTEAAGAVLCALGGSFVDRIEVMQSGKVSEKIAFDACVYGMSLGFLYADRLELPA